MVPKAKDAIPINTNVEMANGRRHDNGEVRRRCCVHCAKPGWGGRDATQTRKDADGVHTFKRKPKQKNRDRRRFRDRKNRRRPDAVRCDAMRRNGVNERELTHLFVSKCASSGSWRNVAIKQIQSLSNSIYLIFRRSNTSLR